jgi:hypothetical protein
LIALTAEQRVEFRKQILKKVVEAGWTQIPESPYKHHFLLEVNNSHANMLTNASTTADDEDFMDLSGL